MKLKVFNLMAIIIVASMAMIGCKKEGKETFTIPSESILITVDGFGVEGTTTFKSHNISAIDVLSVPTGWSVVNIDMYAKSITVKSPENLENDNERSGDILLKGYSPAGDEKSIELYVAILDTADVDYTEAPANCYIANKPATRYLFNPMVGGSNTALDTNYVELIWSTSVDLIKYIDMKEDEGGNIVASFYVEAVEEDDKPTDKIKPGNALIGAYDADGNLLWSWHIWVTNSNPTADTIAINGQTMMNINLGADCNSEGEKDGAKIGSSYGMYYQWGRRTPIVGPESWDFALNVDKYIFNAVGSQKSLIYTESDSSTGTLEWANANPRTIITGYEDNNYDWLYEGHEELWSATEKSEHDPCPAGWRIPDSSVYANLTINTVDDEMAWQEAQGMYGWNLIDKNDQSKSYFFSAAGRRNYLDGRLDIMNDDMDRPVPWSGYYWTATTTEDGMAEAMFFDLNSQTRTWNGFEAARPMRRANAMPVRCVRE
ncbi:MAG: hypothetical protein J6U59_07405 [Alistipes sp.]|nr:hypothetical protein [Alistipes sp.]